MPDGAGCRDDHSCDLLTHKHPLSSARRRHAAKPNLTDHVEPLPDTRHHSTHRRKGLYLSRTLICKHHLLKLNIVPPTPPHICHKRRIPVLRPRCRVCEKRRPISPDFPHIFFCRPESLYRDGDRTSFRQMLRNDHGIEFLNAEVQMDSCRCWIWALGNPFASVDNYRFCLVMGDKFAVRGLRNRGLDTIGPVRLVTQKNV